MKKTILILTISFLIFIVNIAFCQSNNEILIAKAGMKSIFNIDYKYIKTYKENNRNIIVLQSSKTKTNYLGVYIDKNRIIWRTEKDEFKSTAGRWRTHSLDEKIYYKIVGNKIIIDEIYSDGTSRKTFNLSEFKSK